MIINSIEIINFGPFYGKNTITFNNNGKGIHIIRGKNGQGKTSIMKAIRWCLFGEAKDRNQENIGITDLLNKTAYNNDILEMAVELSIEHENSQYKIIRKTHSKTKGSNFIESQLEENIKFTIIKDGVVEPNPQNLIERIIPHKLADYFFFDGEMLRNYEKLLETTDATKIIKDSIEVVLGLPLLINTQSDIAQIYKAIDDERRKIIKRRGDKYIQNAIDEFNRIRDEINNCENSIKETDKKIESRNSELIQLKQQMNDVKDIKEQLDSLNKIETQIHELENEENKLKIDRKNRITVSYKTLLKNKANDLIKELEKQNDTINEKFYEKKDLLSKKRQYSEGIKNLKCSCCGAILDQGKLNSLENKIKDIEGKLSDLKDIELKEDLSQYIRIIKNIQKEESVIETIKNLNENIIDIESEIAKLRINIDTITKNLKDKNLEKVNEIFNKSEILNREIGALQTNENHCKEIIKEDTEEKNKLIEIINKSRSLDTEKLDRELEVLEKLNNLFEKAITPFREMKRKDVAKSANEIFAKLVVKNDFKDLEINDNYGLKIITKNNEILDRASLRSAGEEQIVAFSLIGALNKSAQIRAPIFMDTPFMRLDLAHGRKILEFLPNLSEQVVLLVTDREFLPGDENYITENIRTDLTVKFINEKDGSKIYVTEVS